MTEEQFQQVNPNITAEHIHEHLCQVEKMETEIKDLMTPNSKKKKKSQQRNAEEDKERKDKNGSKS
jgi:hypothetical protein